MSYGYQYDPYDPGWGGKAQPGAIALRDVTMRRVPPVGSLGILRDKSRCNKRSAHCHGRAWDAAIGPTAAEIPTGTALAEFYVLPEVAQELGIQRVIWGFGSGVAAKEWDSRPGQRFWSDYSGPLHDEHVHVELCWAAARTLTEAKVEAVFDAHWGQEDDMAAVPQADWDAVKASVEQMAATVKTMAARVKKLEIRSKLTHDGGRTIGKDIAFIRSQYTPPPTEPEDDDG